MTTPNDTDLYALVKRLRFCATNPGHDEIMLFEMEHAADAIERLRRERDEALAALRANGIHVNEKWCWCNPEVYKP